VVDAVGVLTLADAAGETDVYHWTDGPPDDPDYENRKVHVVNFMSDWDPFTIGDFGDVYGGEVDGKISELVTLYQSWSQEPEVSQTSGLVSHGYDRAEGAFEFTREGEEMSFTLEASRESPVHNRGIVIADWPSGDTEAEVRISGADASDIQQGVILNTEGATLSGCVPGPGPRRCSSPCESLTRRRQCWWSSRATASIRSVRRSD
jgi:hypothetical protein